MNSLARAVALLLCLAAGPWFVWSLFEAAELQAKIDQRNVLDYVETLVAGP